jgi:hypothetical protein
MDLKGIDKDLGRIDRALGKGAPAGRAPQERGDVVDRLDLSGEAREVLAAFDAARALAAEPAAVRADRVAEVRVRIADGFYEQAEVRRAVATKLAFAFLGLAARPA